MFVVVEFVGGRDFDAVMDPVQYLVEDGNLFDVAAVIALVEFVDIDFARGILIIHKEKDRHGLGMIVSNGLKQEIIFCFYFFTITGKKYNYSQELDY